MVRLSLRLAMAVVGVGACPVLATPAGPDARPIELLIPAPAKVGWEALTAAERKDINEAVDRGVDYLKRVQNPNGSFGNLRAMRQTWPVGFTALPGLALLESNIPAKEASVGKAAALVRHLIAKESRTYEIALAILFLDRIGERGDHALIRSLGLRLAGGQSAAGGWGYQCPVLTPAQEKNFVEMLEKRKDAAPPLVFPKPRGPGETADNSNTQFALVALAVARKYDLPLSVPFAMAEQRFRATQRPIGWGYRVDGSRTNGSMTCVGLLGLTLGRAVASVAEPKAAIKEDEAIQRGLASLAAHLKDPADAGLGKLGPDSWGPPGAVNLYFLWSVERAAVLCDVGTIGGIDWYQWGANLLLPSQQKDGSWLGRGNGGEPVIDTSMALLFLKRADLLPDLRTALKASARISDPGRDVISKLSPDSKGARKETMPRSSGDSPLNLNLGDIKVKEETSLPVKVKGPVAYRIKGVRGADVELRVSHDGESRETQLLVLTLTLEQAGDFERTLYLQTDIPGRADVPIQVRARAVEGK